MPLSYFSLWYIILNVGFLMLVVLLYFLFRRRTHNAQWCVLFGLLLFNFALHFLSPLYLDIEREEGVRRLFLQNICATSVVFFPFLFLTKSRFLKTSMIVLGIVSGLVSVLNPVEPMNQSIMQYVVADGDQYAVHIVDTIRFYIQHAILWAVPVLMLCWGHFRLRLRDIWMPAVWLAIMFFVMIANDVIAWSMGLMEYPWSDNGGMQWAPHEGFSFFFEILILPFMRYIPFGANAGEPFLWPVLFALPSIIVYMTLLAILFWAVDKVWFSRLGAKRDNGKCGKFKGKRFDKTNLKGP